MKLSEGSDLLSANEPSSKSASGRRHPLAPLSQDEVVAATEIIHDQVAHRLSVNPEAIRIQSIGLREPIKAALQQYLEAEHGDGATSGGLAIPRLVNVVFGVDTPYISCESVLCLDTGVEVGFEEAAEGQHGILDLEEMNHAIEVAKNDVSWQAALRSLDLEPGVDLEYEAWPYGADKFSSRTTHRLIRLHPYSRSSCNHPDSNVHSRPVPLSAVYDVFEKKLLRIDKHPTTDLPAPKLNPGARYMTEDDEYLGAVKEFTPDLNRNLRPELGPIKITQASVDFTVTDNSLVTWQKWRFRVGFNPREGLTLHDIRYNGRSLFYRLSVSEVSVPYGDPRPPSHLKQAFDLGDSGAGTCANSLAQGCDCLGTIHYFDTWTADPDGSGKPLHMPNVVCLHEVDDGIAWRHLNQLTDTTVAVRNRLLVVQSAMTLGNYDYILAWQFDLMGGIHFEMRATGIVATQAFGPGSVSPWGTVVSPGVFAANHQHFTCVRIDPAIAGPRNSITAEDTVALELDDARNPHGNGWHVVSRFLETASHADASPQTNRVFKIVNEGVVNPISHRAVAYRLVPVASGLPLAHPSSTSARRAKFAAHHIWVTGHRDGMLYAGGKWTTQSLEETGGLADEVARGGRTRDADVVLWHSFGMTHVPRVEDFPVMPIEKVGFSLKPVDFFFCNPAVDVPPEAKGPYSGKGERAG